MMSNPLNKPIIVFSLKVYQLLLFAYPSKFQQEYGPHMLQVFKDCCRRSYHQSGMNGMTRLWVITLFDIFRSVIEEHLQKETFVTKSNFIRLSGWSLMMGAVTFFLFILSAHMESNFYDPFRRLQAFYDAGSVLGIWFTPILLTGGILGLRARYGEQTGNFGQNILLVGAITGPAITFLGMIGSEAGVAEWAWVLLFAGTATLLACLTIWGVLTLQTKPLARWNWLPLVAGLWFPVLLPSALMAEANGMSGNLIQNIATVLIPLQCIALFVLGYMLQADSLEKTPAIA